MRPDLILLTSSSQTNVAAGATTKVLRYIIINKILYSEKEAIMIIKTIIGFVFGTIMPSVNSTTVLLIKDADQGVS